MTRAERITIFCDEIWAWYARNKRTLPWRDIDESNADQKAYLVLVSEIMLQQTQVSRVIILYKNFIQTFPSAEGLSKALNKEVLMHWRGLGYNNRALRLRDAAKEIMKRGMVPREHEELMELPGVGHYTAGAILNFAFGIPTACMDVNIRRILHRFFYGIENADGTWKKDDASLLKLSEEVLLEALKKGSTQDWHAALMDFGSMVMTKNNPKWEVFTPRMKSVCLAYGKVIKRVARTKKEPGRMMAGRFVPNRIFRGRIIEALRDAKTKLTIEQLGAQAIADWSMDDHRDWMAGLIEGLKRDRLVEEVRGRFVLAE